MWSTAVAQNPCFSGPSVRLGVTNTGVYRVDYNSLRNAGLNPDNLDPRKLQLFSHPAGMLPQANALSEGLREAAIQVIGEGDGRFDKDDYIIFYGQGPDRLEYNNSKGLFSYQNNLYADSNYYLLVASSCAGKRVTKVATPTGNPVVTEFADCAIYERDLYNDLKSGRDWVGELMDNRPELTVRFVIPGIIANSTIKVTTSLMAQSYSPSSFKVYWNNAQILDRAMAVIPQTQYGLKGAKSADTVTTNATAVGAVGVDNQDIRIAFTKGATGRSVGYLDYIVLNVTRRLAWYGSPTSFTIPASGQGMVDLDVAGRPAIPVVWDVTDPFNAIEQTTQLRADGLRFGASTATTRSFIAYEESKTPAPLVFRSNESTLPVTTPDLLIVSSGLFLSEAQRLATHRRATYGIDVAVATPEQIYYRYTGGRQDVSAIRNYVRDLFNLTPGKLKNLLLFGRGSYDYKTRVINNSNYVPTYESVNSLSPLETFSSDDFFALLEEHEGEWQESPAANSTLDIGVGRIPVRTAEEARTVVDKLIAYDLDKKKLGGWKKDILFVADDGDWNIHQGDADELAEDIEDDYKRYHTNKIYLDAFKQEETAGGQASPEAAEALSREIDKGYAIINYTGHGNEYVWTDERVLDQNTPYELPSNPRQPLFVTATCEFGRNDNPLVISTAELMLLKKKGGAIGLVTTTRPVHSTTNFFLNKAFYAALFDVSTAVKDLGTIFRETKNSSLSGISNRNFSLLGDPSMRFGLYPGELVMTSISTMKGSDTLKALSEVIVEGEVRYQQQLVSGFNGVAEVSLYDKRETVVTLGDESEPFTYKRWNNLLFRGKATVEGGKFILLFRLPINLATEIGNGKLSMYAVNDAGWEVLGTASNIKIGGLEPNAGNDSKGPLIELFVGDTTFVNGGYANNNTQLIARLFDDNGINTSGYEPAGLTADLDGEKVFILDGYYVADVDDARAGTVTFPLTALEPGMHRITFVAYDNFNNKSTSTIDFAVGESNELAIEEFLTYPNPFTSGQPATFQFTHNRAGDDLEAQLLIYNSMGQLASQKDYFVPASGYKVTLAEWDGQSTLGVKMSDGIYLAKLSVRSLSDGAKNAKIAKLILVN